MPRLNPGILNTWVTLDDPVVDGTPVTFAPARVKVGLRQASPSDEAMVQWTVPMRYHPQITMNTRLTLDDGRQLFVRGLDNIGNADRSGWQIAICQEVVTP